MGSECLSSICLSEFYCRFVVIIGVFLVYSLNDYLVEESVCLLLRASWFEGMPALALEEPDDDYEEDDFDDYYFKSNIRIGNRRWGDNGFVRAGRREARPVAVKQLAAAVAQADEAGSSSFRLLRKPLAVGRSGPRNVKPLTNFRLRSVQFDEHVIT
jgi:hypothetical protein